MWGQIWGTLVWGSGTAVPMLPFWGQFVLAALVLWLGLRLARRMKAIGAVVAAGALLALAPLTARAVLSLPHLFSNGTVADADEVNANFEVLRAAVDGSGAAIVTTFDMNSWVDITPVGVRVPVRSLPLPAGSHLVTATLDATFDGMGACELVLGSGPLLDRRIMSAGLLPNYVPPQEISARIPITLQSPVQLAVPDSVVLQCVTFSTPTFVSLALQIRAARMSAVSVASLTVVP